MIPSGEQRELRAGDYQAVVTEVGATLRALRWRGRSLIRGFAEEALMPVWSGAVLAPWPNRIADGRYRFAGQDYQLSINEIERGAALHGLVAWTAWTARERTGDALVSDVTVWPTPGYPWHLELSVEHRLDAQAGLQITLAARNDSDTAAPYGASIHPYFVAPDGKVDDWILQLRAAEVVNVDDVRLLPLGGNSPVSPDVDFREPRKIGSVSIDSAYTFLDTAGPLEATLTDASGRGVVIRWEPDCQWVQLHTADRPEPELDRTGMAIEPMTCPPDAFNSGAGLIELQPGETVRTSWTIAARDPAE